MKNEETYTWRQIKREKNKQKMSLSVPSRTRVIYLEFRGFNDLNVVFFKACCVIFHGRDVSVLTSVCLSVCLADFLCTARGSVCSSKSGSDAL